MTRLTGEAGPWMMIEQTQLLVSYLHAIPSMPAVFRFFSAPLEYTLTPDS